MRKRKRTALDLTFHKKGMLMPMITFIIVIVVFGMISFFGFQAFSELANDVTEDLQLNQSKQIMTDTESRYPSLIDGLSLLIFLGLWLMGIVSALVSDSHPILFGVMMFLIVFVVIAGAMLGNFAEELFTDSTLDTMPDNFPVTYWLLTHMLIIGVVISSSIALVYFGKQRA